MSTSSLDSLKIELKFKDDAPADCAPVLEAAYQTINASHAMSSPALSALLKTMRSSNEHK